jgi:hypothetical protein
MLFIRDITMGKKKIADDSRHLWEQACTYARAHSVPEKQKARAYYLYKDMAGREPPKHWGLSDTPNVPMSKNFLNQVRAKNIAYAATRNKVAA